jgi:hypothetical protein
VEVLISPSGGHVGSIFLCNGGITVPSILEEMPGKSLSEG